jgi:hypothetical protein
VPAGVPGEFGEEPEDEPEDPPQEVHIKPAARSTVTQANRKAYGLPLLEAAMSKKRIVTLNREVTAVSGPVSGAFGGRATSPAAAAVVTFTDKETECEPSRVTVEGETEQFASEGAPLHPRVRV